MLSLIVPYAWLSASGRVYGRAGSVECVGSADISACLPISLYGASAMSFQKFRDYRQGTMIGVSLQVTAPTGEYDPERLLNLGKRTCDPALGVTVFTDNHEFLGSNTRSQDPLYGLQGRLIYNSAPTLRASLDGTYYSGGRTAVNDVPDDDWQKNSRWGMTAMGAFDIHHSVKIYFNSGVTSRASTDFDAAGIAWQYRWGAELYPRSRV